ncbi:MAG: glycosyltransferase family 2 protein [bacterium]|nr:glycosyltransferase family 2 protein [bacterium]
MDLSIIIVNYKVKELLRDSLHSIAEQTKEISYEVIVVDNNSSDGSQEMLKGEFPEVTLIANKINLGFAGANNQGIEVSQGRYVLLLNPDTIVLDRALEKLVKYMDYHPEAGIVGPKLLNADRSLQLSCGSAPNLWNMFCAHLYLNRIFPKTRFFDSYKHGYGWNYNAISEVDWVSGACLMVRREVIEDIRPLDEGFFLAFDEGDFCKRAKAAGCHIHYYPQVRIIHLVGQATKKVPQTRIYNYRSALRYFRKHHSLPAVFLLKGIFTLSLTVKSVINLVFFLICPGKRQGILYNLGAYQSAFKEVITCGNRDSCSLSVFVKDRKKGKNGYG